LIVGSVLFHAYTTSQAATAAVPDPNCTIVVPQNPLTAQGLATPYQLTATNAANGPCNEANVNQSAFVQGAILDPATGKVSLYDPLVIDQGTQAAITPTAPQLPANAIVGLWFGFQGTNLTLQDTMGSLMQGQCINGAANSVFGQFAYCNAPAFFQAANLAIQNGLLQVPAPGTGNDGLQCLTTRDFGLVDQDQSDNVTTSYLLSGNNQIAQNTAANLAQLAANTNNANANNANANTANGNANNANANNANANGNTNTNNANTANGNTNTNNANANNANANTANGNTNTNNANTANGNTNANNANANTANANNQAAAAAPQVLTNASDNLLLVGFEDKALGCTPMMAPDLADNGTLKPSLPLNELQAAAAFANAQNNANATNANGNANANTNQQNAMNGNALNGMPLSQVEPATAALIPLNDPMVLNNANADAQKEAMYQVGVDQPLQAVNGTTYCMNLGNIGPARIVFDMQFTQNATSPSLATANSLFTFLANRINQAWMNLNCAQLLGQQANNANANAAQQGPHNDFNPPKSNQQQQQQLQQQMQLPFNVQMQNNIVVQATLNPNFTATMAAAQNANANNANGNNVNGNGNNANGGNTNANGNNANGGNTNANGGTTTGTGGYNLGG
jgi:hypothetical protein